MPEEFREMKLVKEYENFGLYTNGRWNECFTRFDLGMITKRRLAEVKLFNDSTGGKNVRNY